MLWDAETIGIARTDQGFAYRVKYKGWGSRFDEWVTGHRVVEPNKHNIEVQEEMITEFVEEKQGLPEIIRDLEAKSYLSAKDRHLPAKL